MLQFYGYNRDNMQIPIEKFTSKLSRILKVDIRYAATNGTWLLSAHAVSIVSILVTSYIFANYVPAVVYGQYKYLLTVGILLTAFSFTGAGTAITQAAAKEVAGFFGRMRKINFRYSHIITRLAASASIYYLLQGNSELAAGLALIAVFQPLFNNSMLIFPYLQGTQQFRINTFTQIVKTVFVAIVMIISVFLTDAVLILLASYFIANIIANYTAHYLFAPQDTEEISDPVTTASILRYGKHSSIQNIVSGISNQLDKILIFQNLGAIDLATYAFATALPDQFKSLTVAIETLLLPRFSTQSNASVKSGMFRKTVIYFVLLVVCVGSYMLVAPYIFQFLYPEYERATFLSQIYALGILTGIGGVPLTALRSQLSSRKLYQFNIFTSGIQVISLLILLPKLGLLGAVIARIIYRTSVCVSAFYLYYKK